MDIRNGEQLLELMWGYQVPCTVAARLTCIYWRNCFGAPTAAEVAAVSGCDLRAVNVLLDALAAVRIIVKNDDRY